MSASIIRVENLSKLYRLKHQQSGTGDGLRHILNHWATAPFHWAKSALSLSPSASGNSPVAFGALPPRSEDFWALKDISFEVKQGDIVGIIGRNGAGKSTLLKILSRITEPTSGRIEINGRVASLLEVGTGFHPELTGRENIFLNGAILGMGKAEIKSKFDEIVDFAEVEKFLDTPVKRYSSGMYVRLAFAVAAHLEPEILIVDEVLAVGDAQFQEKCLGKMGKVSREGRTVLFVSHQIAAVTRLCQRALWMDAGKIRADGHAAEVCTNYLANGSLAGSQREWNDDDNAPGNEWVRLESVETQVDRKPAVHVDIRTPVDIHITYRVLKEGKVLIPNIHLFTENGTLIFISHDWYSGWRKKIKPPGKYRTTFTVPGNFFNIGRISVKVAMGTYEPFEAHFEESDVVAFTVVESDEGDTSRGDFKGYLPGIVRPLIASKTIQVNRS